MWYRRMHHLWSHALTLGHEDLNKSSVWRNRIGLICAAVQVQANETLLSLFELVNLDVDSRISGSVLLPAMSRIAYLITCLYSVSFSKQNISVL